MTGRGGAERERETGRDGEKVKVKERRSRWGTSSVAAGGSTTGRMQTNPGGRPDDASAPAGRNVCSQARPKATPEPLDEFL